MPPRYVVSRFAFVSWSDGNVQLTSPVSRKTLLASDPSMLSVLSAFATPRTIDDVIGESQELATVIDEWIAASILVDADTPEPAALQHWDRDALALHASSRDPKWRKTPGHQTPAIAPRRSNVSVPLAPRGAGAVDTELAALLDARRSRRTWASAPIAFQTFSDFLWLSARNRTDERRRKSVSRPYPSGGAAYSLELYPVVAEQAVDGLNCGVYRYLPQEHALEVVSPFSADFRPFLVAAGKAARTTPAPVAIIITSRYARQSEEYSRLAYSLVLKEVGCLFQTFYLVAESLGLAACAIGGRTPPGLLAELCRTTELEEPVVGEFALGVASD